MKRLKESWHLFLSIIWDPFFITFFAVTGYLYWISTSQKNPELTAILTFFISVTSGIVGAIIKKRWSDVTEGKVIEARGKAAVRSLKLLLGNIMALEKRVCDYLSRWQDEKSQVKQNTEVMKTYLEEVIGRCRIQEEEAISSIENWTDIIPEANITTQIGVISNLREEADKRSEELKALKEALGRAKSENLEEKERLRKEIQKKEDELRKVKKELRTTTTATLPYGTSGYGGPIIESTHSLLGRVLADATSCTCTVCGKVFVEFGPVPAIPRCFECEKKGLVPKDSVKKES
jgi:hypothetical protein